MWPQVILTVHRSLMVGERRAVHLWFRLVGVTGSNLHFCRVRERGRHRPLPYPRAAPHRCSSTFMGDPGPCGAEGWDYLRYLAARHVTGRYLA